MCLHYFLVDIFCLFAELLCIFFCFQLHQISLEAKKEHKTDVKVEMISYSANLGYSHNLLYLDPNLVNVVG